MTSKYSVTSDPITSLSTVGSTDSSLDGVYTLTLTVTDQTNSANTRSTSVTVRVIFDVCTPNLVKVGSMNANYDYTLG